METKQRKVIMTITILYTLFILYFLFLAFGRIETSARITDYTFIIIPNEFYYFPSMSDLLHFSLMDVVGFGNFAAFIPFGILIPMLYRTGFVRFITLFFLSIIVIELIQMVTFLGSFDINDAIQNTLGAAAGYGAYTIGSHAKNTWRKFFVTGISSVLLLLAIWGFCELLEKAFTKAEGPLVALNELEDHTKNTAWGAGKHSFQIGGQQITPQLNVYSSEGKEVETYTYHFEDEEIVLYGNYGIPDEADFEGEITISADGNEVLSTSAQYQMHQPDVFEIPFQKIKELKITIEGNEKLWDVSFKKMDYFWN
ncbi:hypothetical protein GCM10010912_03680 [Paenibacillus albidus]|uniref:VanZ-like domain-containing protein n=1 Tax=Paenibacillus albidus TaxID=2041023 RepID=A0A917C099_9BACL|nr:VanZ family protein [Paenibacillus albidus]GGF61803.1 hypothetical protein GCM10010912_03680 [Paenibacillus albidus]